MFGFGGSSNLELNPYLGLAVSCVYMVAADGELSDEEMGALVSIFGGDEEIIDKAVKYIEQNNELEKLINDLNGMLNNEQKESLLINLLDLLLADGSADDNEQALFFKFAETFGFTQEQLEGHFDTIVSKNNKAMFR
jgi:uncharacterized tellurite resistance protein B-like protein